MDNTVQDPSAGVVVNGEWGQVTLSPKAWNYARWNQLDKAQKRHVYLCYASLPYFFHKIILPWESEQRGEDYPEELPAFMDECLLTIQSITKYCPPAPLVAKPLPQRQLCYVIPMGHFKTTMLCVGVPLWLVGKDNDSTFLMACSSQNLAMDRVVRLKEHIAGNEFFIDMFGELKPKGMQEPWSKERATVTRGRSAGAPTFQAFGTSTDVQGTRFDYGIVDDAVNERNITSAKMRVETFEYITASVWSRLNARSRVELVLGTIYHHGDAYNMIREKAETDKTWIYIEKQAILNPDCWPPHLPKKYEYHSPEAIDELDFSEVEALWPEYWTPERLYLDYCQGPNEFARTRMNQPVDPASKIFKEEIVTDMCRADGKPRTDGDVRPKLMGWNTSMGRPKSGSMIWQRYKQEGMDLAGMKTILSIDPAGGSVTKRSSKKLDFTVFELWAILDNNCRVLVDMWHIHGFPLKRVKAQYGEWLTMYGPDEVLFEAYAHQRVTAASWEAEFGVPIKPVLMKNQKFQDIEALADLVHSGMLLYPWASSADRKKFGKFEDELTDYPDGKNDDTLMAALYVHNHVKPSGVVRRAARFKGITPGRMGLHQGRLTYHNENDDDFKRKGLHLKIEDVQETTAELIKFLGIRKKSA